MERVKAIDFFQAWVKIVHENKQILSKDWQKHAEFTNHIMGSKNSIMKQVALELSLEVYDCDYYLLDTILYKPEDKLDDLSGNWFHDIRVAFEHENHFKSGLYQEVSHLLITNCDLRVLVCYPPNDEQEEAEINKLHKIISKNRLAKSISDDESFLIILGYESGFEWWGQVYKYNEQENWKPIGSLTSN